MYIFLQSYVCANGIESVKLLLIDLKEQYVFIYTISSLLRSQHLSLFIFEVDKVTPTKRLRLQYTDKSDSTETCGAFLFGINCCYSNLTTNTLETIKVYRLLLY